MQTTTETKNQDIKQLNSFLRGEISAVETYNQCIDKMKDLQLASTLKDLKRSHQIRVERLQSHITDLGGVPETDSGVWGSFAKLVEGGSKLFGETAAISTLEEGEDHGLRDYKQDCDKLSITCQQWLKTQILPEQERTHGTLSRLKTSVKASA